MFPQVFGKYVLEREIAAGGMAVVYLATLRGAGGFEKKLVVKQIRAELANDDAFVRRFVDEAKTAVELSHPNIVPVYELGVEQGVYYIAMEFAEGVTLSELLKHGGPLTPEEGAYLGVEVCRALDYAHRRGGVVHRDVTPRNVVIDEEGAVRLIDFGIAAPVTPEGPHRRERVFGSPGHMPAEQIRGGRLTPATDVFAVGALLIEAWTGVAPFRRATAVESEEALATAPPPITTADERLAPLASLIASSVSFDAKDRPQRADDLARPLREFLKSSDAGDIARALGARVRRARSGATPEQGDAVKSAGAATPTTRRIPSVPPTAAESTRKIPSIPPAPASRGSGPDTQTFAAGPRLLEWTRMEAPDEDARPAERSAPAARRHLTRWGVPVALAAIALAAGYTLRSDPPAKLQTAVTARGPGEPVPDTARNVATGVAGASASRAPRAVASAPGSSEPRVPEPVTSAPAAPAKPPPRSGDPGAAPPSEGSAQARTVGAFGTLHFTSDLPAIVTLDGQPLGPTPIRGVRRPEGRYSVTFANQELSERAATAVQVHEGETVALHAEFTGAAPRVRVR